MSRGDIIAAVSGLSIGCCACFIWWDSFIAWLRPTLQVPVAPLPELTESPVLASPVDSIAGFRNRSETLLVTSLGDFLIPAGSPTSVLEVQHAVAWIAHLPETTLESRRA